MAPVAHWRISRMLSYTLQQIDVMNGGRHLVCEAAVYPWKDAVLLADQDLEGPEDIESLPAGCVVRSNAKLAEDTDGNSTVMIFVDAHDAMLSGFHTVKRYGIFEPLDGTEIEELERDVASSQDYSRFLLAIGVFTPEEQEHYVAAQAERAERYATKVDKDKVAAQEVFATTVDLADSTGRRNPSAAAMRNGGAIGKLMRRKRAVRNIGSYTDWRNKYVYWLIRDHMRMFGDLWCSLSMNMRSTTEEQRADAERVFGPSKVEDSVHTVIHESRGAQGLKLAEIMLGAQRDTMRSIKILPFAKAAEHLCTELDLAIALCQAGNRAELRQLLGKMRRGLRWPFVQDKLFMDVYVPYTFLLDALKLRSRGAARQPITHDTAPDRFTEIESILDELIVRIEEKCDETNLDHKIKGGVLSHLRKSRQLMAAGEMVKAKELLSQAIKKI